MKITLIKTDKKNRNHLSHVTLDKLMELMKDEKKYDVVTELRRQLPMLQAYTMRFDHMYRLPRVYVTSEFSVDDRGELVFCRPTGLLLLTAAGMASADEVEQAKQAAATLPMTQATFAGASGRSVKILVRIALADGTLPTQETEWQKLCQQAYDYAVRLYDAVLPRAVSREAPTLCASLRMTLDARPFYRPDATPLCIGQQAAVPQPAEHPVTSAEQHKKTDYAKYDDNEFLYRRACEQVADVIGEHFASDDPRRDDAFVTEVARQLCLMGMGEEEAIVHMHSHLWTRQDEQHIRTIVASAYAEAPAKKPKDDMAVSVRRDTMALIEFLQKRYVFRYNTVMGYTEYRPNNTYVASYQPVDSRVQKRFALEARMQGLDVWDNDIARYVGSDFVESYNPVWDYLYTHCQGKWDGRDRIRELARTVPTDNVLWPQWFYTWFLAMVRQWQSTPFDLYGNQTAPLLISSQGFNKSTFCRQLLPPELAWGYNDNLLLSEKKQVLQAMSQMLLVNLDEFNQVSPQMQQGFLKNIITMPSLKLKRPYGKHVENFARRASFIATTNMTDVLTDPTGSRRFLAVELTGPIDVSRRPNYVQLYAQALAALDGGEPAWFDEVQTQQIIDSNRLYEQHSTAEQLFNECFEPAASADEPGATFLTAAAIFSRIRQQAGAGMRQNSLKGFGVVLSNIPGLQRKRTSRGSEYLVRPQKK